MKPPAFQFYAAEYLADEHVQLMTLEEEGAYIRLLAFCWREGSIPSDLDALSRLCKGASTTLLSKVVPRFNRAVENGSRLVHTRLEAERKKQQEWREKSALGGKASAHKRKHPKQIKGEQGGATKAQPDRLNQSPTLQSSSLSATSLLNEKKERRADRPPDPRVQHPAIQAIWKTRGRYPLKDLWDSIIETIGDEPDLERMKKCWLKWRGKGFNSENYGWLTDWYMNGEDNGTERGGYTTNAERRDADFRGYASVVTELRSKGSGAVDETVRRKSIPS